MEPLDLNKMTDVQLYILNKEVGDNAELLEEILSEYKVSSLKELTAPQAYEVVIRAQACNREKRAQEREKLKQTVANKINDKLGTRDLPGKIKIDVA